MSFQKPTRFVVFAASLVCGASLLLSAPAADAADAKAKTNWPNYYMKMCQTKMKDKMSEKQAKSHCYYYKKHSKKSK